MQTAFKTTALIGALLAGALALTAAGNVRAQGGTPGPETQPLSKPPSDKPVTPPSTSFEALDQNSDGQLSSEELGPSNPAGSMSTLDRDRDGRISPLEYSNAGRSKEGGLAPQPMR